ncbi:helix-turn-helix transcriptional regulator [Ureibacillus sp. FSL E2-3493]|uniref:helix-turn-helix transcriptional regulator n=1 Tax=Ureibacillus sp. FSL E2-3493 TaxID=2921367 RepID=UPI0031199547
MHYPIQFITEYYAQASIIFTDMFINSMPKGSRDRGRYTGANRAGIIIPLNGSAKFSLNGTPYYISAGTIVHAGPQMAIDIEVIGEDIWQYAVIHYQVLDDDVGKFPYFNQHFSLPIDDSVLLSDLTHQLMKNYIKPTNISQITCKQLFLKIVEAILLSSIKKNDNGSLMDQAVRLLHDQYVEPITIQEIASQLGIERRRFAYLFERHTGLSPIQYLTEIRIRRAKVLLQSGYSVAEVAEKVGYVDHFYFSRVFKKQTGMSPSKFKNSIR